MLLELALDSILDQSGKLVALEIKTGSRVRRSDAASIRAFRDSFKEKQSLVRSVVLHAGQGRPPDTDILALLGAEWWCPMIAWA